MAEKIQIGELVYKVTGDVSGLKAALQNVDVQAEKSANTFQKLGGFLKQALAVGGTYALGKTLVKASSDAEETANKFRVVFSTIADGADTAAKKLAESFGYSLTASKDLLASTGNILQGIGYTQEASLKLSEEIVGLGSDITSFTNYAGGSAQATQILTKALLGERDALQALDLKVTQDELDKLAKAQGKVYASLTQQQQAELTLSVIRQKSANAIGDFARSSDSFANVQRQVNAHLDDLATSLGNEILPGITDLFRAFNDSVDSGGVIIGVLGSVARAAGFVAESLATTVRMLDLMTIDQKQREFEGYQNAAIEMTKSLRAEYGSLAKLKEKAAAGDKEAIKDYGALMIMEADMANKQRDMNKLSGEEERLRKTLKGIKEEEIKIEGQKKAAIEKQKPAIQANAAEAKKAADAEKAALAELEEQYRKKVDAMLSMMNEIGGGINNVLSAGAQLAGAINQARLDELDARMQKELEAAGLAEETQVEQAQREYDAAVATGDALNIEEKRRQLEKAKITEKYEKKRRQLEYEGALMSWKFQLAQAVASAPLAVANALAAGWKYGPVVAGIYAGLAAAASGIQIAAVAAAEPEKPKFAEGGIVPGTATQGDTVPVLANSGELILTQEQQKKLLNGGTGNIIHIHNYIGSTEVGDAIYQMTQDGLIKIDARAVVA